VGRRGLVSRSLLPVAFLLAVTAAVLGIHYGVQQRPAPAAVAVRTTPAVPHRHVKRHVLSSRYAIVQRGDSFSSIAVRTHTSVAELERLNPGVSTTALRVGQRIRVR
jgi:LysM repeat protein